MHLLCTGVGPISDHIIYINSLKKIQCRAVRCTYMSYIKYSRFDSVSDILHSLHWPTLETSSEIARLSFFHKINPQQLSLGTLKAQANVPTILYILSPYIYQRQHTRAVSFKELLKIGMPCLHV